MGVIAVDAALVARARAGDQAAFADLVARHGAPAWRIASALAATPADAEVAVARAFTTALRQLDAGTASTATAFRVLVTRTAIDEVTSSTSADVPVDHPRNSLVAAYRSLPLQWRAVLWLTVVEGGSTAQVGALLAQPTDAVGRLAQRAQAGLRQRYLAVGGRRHDDLLDNQRDALRSLASPVPPTLAGAALTTWLAWRAGISDDRHGLAAIAAIGPWAERTVAGAIAAVITAGIASAIALGGKDATTKSVTAAPAGSGELAGGATGAAPAESDADAVPSTRPPTGPSSRATSTSGTDSSAGSTSAAAGVGSVAPSSAPVAPKTPPALPTTDAPPPTTTPEGVTLTADLPNLPVGVTVGPDPGVQIGTTTVGTPPPVTGTGVTISAEVPGLPPIVVRVL